MNGKEYPYLQIVDRTLGKSTMRRVAEIPDIDDPNQHANSRDNLRQHIPKIIQLLLQRRRLRNLRRNTLMNITNRGTRARKHNHSRRMSRHHCCSRKQHVDLVLLDGIRILDRTDVFSYALAFSGEDRLIDAEAVALDGQEAAVGRDSVSHGHGYDVSRYQIICLDTLEGSVTNDLGLIGRVFLECGNGLFCAGFLRDADDGIED